MKKTTKLTERGSRFSDTRQIQLDETIPLYLHEVEPLHSESARSHRFAMLVHELLGLEPGFIESYSSGIEKYLKVRQKDRILRGRADNLFGNVLIEFESNIPKNLGEAEEQLRRYVAILWSQEVHDAHTPYLCIATDGIRFVTYSPILTKAINGEIAPCDVSLKVVEEANWARLQPREVYYWLDRYFLRREILPPTSETLVRDFGIKSHAFQTTTHALLTLWQEIKTQSAFSVIFESWEKYLRIAYGSAVASDELFIRHTYLATLAKLMAWKRITESSTLPDEPQIVEMLEGQLFKAHGIENFIEEDFFSWLARGDIARISISMTHKLFSLLQNYNLRELSEDVLKSLYQELVDPETRHDLGEFYTPDWLAHRVVNRLLDENPKGTFLDPACGSGTFLYLTIREKRERLGDSSKTLFHVLDSVQGADIHPLAVIIAKTNYILALGDLLKKPRRGGPITIPIYLSDTLRLPQRLAKVDAVDYYEVIIDSQPIWLPEPLLQDSALYDQAIELAKEFARQNKDKPITIELFHNFLVAQHFPQSDNEVLAKQLFTIADTLKHFIDIDRDTIWAFVLKNIYKPLFFKQRFDFIVGNPPWIAFRYMEPDYQGFLRRQITQEYKLLTGSAKNIPNLEIAALFMVRAADLYLKEGGRIAFVLPRSLFSADQHDGLRRRTFKFSEDSLQNLFWHEVWDCEGVKPLFNVPACVLMADKRQTAKIEYPIAGQILSGKLKRKNATLREAERTLTVEDIEISLHQRGRSSFWATGKDTSTHSPSYYKKGFQRGADIHPRSFWFVQVPLSPLGFNPDLPPLESADRARKEAKDAYKSVYFKGTVESRFLYATLLSTDLLPFGHLDYRLVVLPIEPLGDHHRLVDAAEARKRGFLHLAQWLKKVEEEWKERRSAKAGQMTATEWLDYRGKLTEQNPQAKYRVLYNTSGTFLTAAVIESEEIEFKINGQRIAACGFIIESVTYFYEARVRNDAFYVAAILNAPLIDKLVKPMQARGLWGPRHFHKKVLELPIPKFDPANTAHQRLVELGQECNTKVEQWVASGGGGKVTSIGKLRGMVREMLKRELAEIDELVRGILGE